MDKNCSEFEIFSMKVVFLMIGIFLKLSITHYKIIVLNSDFMKTIFTHGHQMNVIVTKVLPLDYLKKHSSLIHI